jgi:protein TonB
MFENKRRSDGAVDIPDRRTHARVPVRSLAYLALDGGNGGVVLNVCEGGIAVQTAGIITAIFSPKMRFRLPQSETWIEAAGKLAWQGPSRKEAGIRFVALTEDTRERIKSWIDSVALETDFPSEMDPSRAMPESEQQSQGPQGFFKNDPLAEFDSMFPSETSLPPTRRPKRDPAPAAPGLDSSAEAAPTPPTSPPQDWAAVSPSPQPAPAAPADRVADRAEEPPLRPEDSPRTAPSVAGTSFYEEMLAAQPESASHHDSGAARLSESAPAPKLESVAVAPGAREIPFTAFGYQPAAFEEPAGKEWIVVVAALAALLILGVVVSVGPAKLTALLFHRAPTPASTEAAVPGPPPPYGATDKNSAKPRPKFHSNAAAQSPEADSGAAAGTVTEKAPQEGLTSELDTETVRAQAPNSSETPAFPGSSETQSSETKPIGDQPYETPEEKEEKVRQFQLDHSGTTPVMPPPVIQTPSSSPPQVATPNPVPVSPRTERPSGTSGPVASFSPLAPAPSGTVAISSHFQSLPSVQLQSRDSLQIGQLIFFREPSYPIEAVRERVEGTVTLRVDVSQVGTVESVRLISGPPLLTAAAVNSVRTWRYRQTILNGRAVESIEDVAITFQLGNNAASPR